MRLPVPNLVLKVPKFSKHTSQDSHAKATTALRGQHLATNMGSIGDHLAGGSGRFPLVMGVKQSWGLYYGDYMVTSWWFYGGFMYMVILWWFCGNIMGYTTNTLLLDWIRAFGSTSMSLATGTTMLCARSRWEHVCLGFSKDSCFCASIFSTVCQSISAW